MLTPITQYEMESMIEEAENILHALRRDAKDNDVIEFEQHCEDLKFLIDAYTIKD